MNSNNSGIPPSNETFEEMDVRFMKKLKKNSQNFHVYIYLRDVGTLTVDEWYQKSGTTTLTQRVGQLKKNGAIIENVYEEDKKKNYARYVLIKG